ncbi:MAG: hypothetical protein BWY70_00083 [Bacteroidetes bacterium ADurb.Bin408]|nr:MAG: hypothetical protein BWY70_00083 [Bacteroidetes bacterium ADurb.Bin408]
MPLQLSTCRHGYIACIDKDFVFFVQIRGIHSPDVETEDNRAGEDTKCVFTRIKTRSIKTEQSVFLYFFKNKAVFRRTYFMHQNKTVFSFQVKFGRQGFPGNTHSKFEIFILQNLQVFIKQIKSKRHGFFESGIIMYQTSGGSCYD